MLTPLEKAAGPALVNPQVTPQNQARVWLLKTVAETLSVAALLEKLVKTAEVATIVQLVSPEGWGLLVAPQILTAREETALAESLFPAALLEKLVAATEVAMVVHRVSPGGWGFEVAPPILTAGEQKAVAGTLLPAVLLEELVTAAEVATVVHQVSQEGWGFELAPSLLMAGEQRLVAADPWILVVEAGNNGLVSFQSMDNLGRVLGRHRFQSMGRWYNKLGWRWGDPVRVGLRPPFSSIWDILRR